MPRYEDDDDEPRRRQPRVVSTRSAPVERKVISPRIIRSLRWAMIFCTTWCLVVIFLLLTGWWSFTGATSDVYLKVSTMFFAVLAVICAWHFPTGKEDDED